MTSNQASPPPATSPRRHKLRNALLTSIVGMVAAWFAAELAIRYVVFHQSPGLGRLGEGLRHPYRYADGNCDDDYWKLTRLQQGPAGLSDAPGADPVLGWTGSVIKPESYEHAQEKSIGDRQLVLLYGDSFANGVGRERDRFQSILGRSELAQKFALLNYGVGGYGLDQIYLLLKNSLDRFQTRDPIVIVSVLVEGDLERSVLSFRSWPKPRLDVVGNELVARGPVQTNVKEYLAEHPLSIRSYLWRLFLFQTSPFMADQRAKWRGVAGIEAEKERLNRQILVEIERELTRRQLRHFVLLFHNENGALAMWKPFQWQEKLLHDVCAEYSIPLVDTRTYLSFASDARADRCAQFYGHGEPLNGHHNALGNLVCFEAIRQGISGTFDQPVLHRLARMKRYGLIDSGDSKHAPAKFLGRPAILTTHGARGLSCASETSTPARLLLGSDEHGSTALQFELGGASKRFTGRLHTLDSKSDCAETDLDFVVEIDDEIVLEAKVPPETSALALDFDLDGKRSMVLIVDGNRGSADCNWVCIENPRIE